jgi:gas vesicle protein
MFFAYPLLAQDISGAFKDIGSELKNSLKTVLDAIDKNVIPALQDTAKKAEDAIAPVLRDVEKEAKKAKDALNKEKPLTQPPVKEYRV